jgi:hypothetical protein
VDYAAVEGSIVSVTNNSENGQLSFKVQKSGTLTTQLAITNANVILSARPILPTASPASTATGVTGEITWDNGYFYVCTATNTWKKVGISTDGVPGSTSAFSSGSAASPSITFADDTNTGIFNPAADAVGISTGGTERFRVDSTGQIEAVSLGTAAAPTYTFTTDPDTGIYSPGANQLAISTNGSERMRLDSSGRLGIGTSSPQNLLHVAGAGGIRISDSANAVLNIRGDSGANSYIYFAETSVAERGIIGYPAGSGDLIYRSGANTFTSGTERLRIDSSGRLLLGTSSARGVASANASLLQVETNTSTLGISCVRNTNDGAGGFVCLGKSRGLAIGSVTVVQNSDILGEIRFAGADGTDLETMGASISAQVDGTPGTNDMPGRIVLSTTLDGASSPTEALRITNDRVIAYNRDAPAAVNATATLTVANLKTGIITSTSAAATDMTLPTGTLTEGGFSGVYTNMTFEWSVINTGPSLVRVLAGTDHTIVGSGSVATGTSGRFASRRTAANTFVAYRLS